MKPQKFLLAVLLTSSPVLAQVTDLSGPTPVLIAPRTLNAVELAELLGPIALYPDALVALILPASTVPSDVVLGARYLRAKNDPDQVVSQPWDESVRSLVRYPDVLTWMDENLEWTASVGEAFVEQPADVMNAIQALRARAQAAGNLKDTPEQRVVVREEIIRIIPADPEYIYVPQYDPQVVYVESYDPAPLLTFGVGFAVGAWLNYDFDWNQGSLYRGNWRGWNNNRDNNWNDGGWYDNPRSNGNNSNVNVINIDNNNSTQWQPTTSSVNQITQRQRNNRGNARFVRAREAAIAERQDVRQDLRQTERQVAREAARTNLPSIPQPTRLTQDQRQDRRDQKSLDRETRRNVKDGKPQNPAADLPSADVPTPEPKKERPAKEAGKKGGATPPANVAPTPPANPQPADVTAPSTKPPIDRKVNAADRDARNIPDAPKTRKNVAPSTAPTVPGELARPDRPRKEVKTAAPSESPSAPSRTKPARTERSENKSDRKTPSAPPSIAPTKTEPNEKVRERKVPSAPAPQRPIQKSVEQAPNRPAPPRVVPQKKQAPSQVQPQKQQERPAKPPQVQKPRQQQVVPQPAPRQQKEQRKENQKAVQQAPKQQAQPKPEPTRQKEQRKEKKQAAPQAPQQAPVTAPVNNSDAEKDDKKKS